MNLWKSITVSLVIFTFSSFEIQARPEATVQFLQAVLDAQGQALKQKVDVQDLPILEPTVLLPELASRLTLAQVQESLWLEKTARAYLGKNGPLYIHLKAGGNHPERGFYLKTKTEFVDHSQTHYMVLSPSPDSIELILPHENGHLIMNQLMHHSLEKALKDWPRTLFPHTVSATSNYLTAFSEGFGIHFETRIGDLKPLDQQPLPSQNYTSTGPQADYYHEINGFLTYAQSQRRYQAVKANRFVFSPLRLVLPTSIQTPSQQLLYDWVNPDLSLSQLKSAQQVLANEGVLATLFYRLVSDSELGSQPLPRHVLQRFNLGSQDLNAAQQVYLKIFVALADLKPAQISTSDTGLQPLMLAMIQNWAERMPADRERLFALFLETTKYLTIDPEAANRFQNLYTAGAILDIQALPKLLQASEKMRRQSLQSALANPTQLGAMLGPQLWLRYPEVKLDLPAFGIIGSPLLLNLNTASALQLRHLPGLSTADQAEILGYRQQKGDIQSIADLAIDPQAKQSLEQHLILKP